MAYDQADSARYYAGPRRDVVCEANEICDKLSLLKPLSLHLRRIYAHTCLDLADYQEDDGEKSDLNLILTSERLWDQIHQDDSTSAEARGMLVFVRLRLADELAARGRVEEASEWRKRSPSTARGIPELLYDVATNLALNAEFVGNYPTKLDAQQLATRRGRYRKNAMAMLHEAVADGFKDLGRVRNDPLFTSFRSDPEFQAIMLDMQFPTFPIAPPSVPIAPP